MKQTLTAERLRELLHYDPETGVFRWRRTFGRATAGAEAGAIDNHGYNRIQVDCKLYRAHRLAWLYMTGAWPAGDLDHIDTDRGNARWLNLRSVSRAENMQNQRRAHSNNLTTGLLGTYRQGNRFRARIRYDGKARNLGMFATPEEAHEAYLQAKRQLHAGCTL